MKFYFDQVPSAGRKMVVGPFENQIEAAGYREVAIQNMVAAREKDPSALLFTFTEPYQAADDWLQQQPRCCSRITRLYEGVEREFMLYTDGSEELVPLEG